MDVEVSFQGGGAKFVALLAVVESIYELFPKKNLRITHVSGSSAGAIAAIIVASRINPKLFRENYDKVGDHVVSYLRPYKNYFNIIFKAVTGYPIVPEDSLNFLIENLLSVSDLHNKRLSDLDIPLTIYTTDITKNNSHYYTRETDISVRDAVKNSSRLPFVFHGFRSGIDQLDGGLINNLPIKHSQSPRNLIAISFHNDKRSETSSLSDWIPFSKLAKYVGRIISIPIDFSVSTSIESIDKNNVFYISTPTSAYDFQNALTHDMNLQNYRNTKDRFESFIENYIDYRNNEFIKSPANYLMDKVFELYKKQRNESEVFIEKMIYEWKSKSLYDRDPDAVDSCSVQIEFRPETDNLMSFGFQHGDDEGSPNLGDVRATVMDDHDVFVDIVEIALSDDPLNKSGGSHVIIFFAKPLIKGVLYTISFEVLAREVMYNIIEENKGSDYITFGAKEYRYVKEVMLIVLLPKYLSNVHLSPYPAAANDATFIDGREMTQSELKKAGPDRVKYHRIGWLARNLEAGGWTGFVASITKPVNNPKGDDQ